MKTTLTSMHAATAAPCAVMLPAAWNLGSGVPAALRFRADVELTAVDVKGSAVDAAPPPRGAPV